MNSQDTSHYIGALSSCRDIDGLELFDFEFSESGSEISGMASRLVGQIKSEDAISLFAVRATWVVSAPSRLHIEFVSKPESDVGSTVSMGHVGIIDGTLFLESLCNLDTEFTLDNLHDLEAYSLSSKKLSKRDVFRSKANIYNASAEMFDLLEDFQKQASLTLAKNLLPTQELSF